MKLVVPSLRLQPAILGADQTALHAIADLGDYEPTHEAYNIDTLRALETAMMEARQAEQRVLRAVEAAREQAIATAWMFHQAMKGARVQVLAQYGSDSLALHAVGWWRRVRQAPAPEE